MIKIKPSKDGGWYWVILAANNQVLATSETYTRKSNCLKGVEAAKKVFKNLKIVVE